MTPEQQALVRESWRQFQPWAGASGFHFYEQLFALDPALERLFADTEIEQQEGKLLAMLGEIVRALDHPVELVPELAGLGRRHVQYGVSDGDYDSVGSALLWSLLHLAGVQAVDPDYEILGRRAVTLDDLKAFRQLDSHCPGHPEYRWTSGVEATTGPPGQGDTNRESCPQ